jgi:hypothetical protein
VANPAVKLTSQRRDLLLPDEMAARVRRNDLAQEANRRASRRGARSRSSIVMRGSKTPTRGLKTMSMLVVVTFDLHGAPSAEYPRVQAALANLTLRKQIRSKKSGRLSKMPHNTFVARFSGKWNKKRARKLRNYVRKSVRTAVQARGLNATMFVGVGERWAGVDALFDDLAFSEHKSRCRSVRVLLLLPS